MKRKTLIGNIDEIKKAMDETRDKNEFRRIQCVYLAIIFPEITAKNIAKITCLSESRVWAIHSIYRKSGPDGLKDKRGGRYRAYLTTNQEGELLKPFVKQGGKGTLVTIDEIKKTYEEKVGREVAESTIYRILTRHNFRKIVPYKRHRNANPEVIAGFKKTLQP